jgi:hypothetical protein
MIISDIWHVDQMKDMKLEITKGVGKQLVRYPSIPVSRGDMSSQFQEGFIVITSKSVIFD